MKQHTPLPLHPQAIKGATLVEVMVSVFLLTFGVLGLMAAQIRGVANISEAENRSVVAQAAENLAEAMQINPSVQESSSKAIIRRYPEYIRNTGSITPDPSLAVPVPLSGGTTATNEKGDISKKALADAHLNMFEYGLHQIPNATQVQYAICLDKANSADPTADSNGNISANCQPVSGADENNKTVIKVVWTIRADNKNSDPAVYAYQLTVPQ